RQIVAGVVCLGIPSVVVRRGAFVFFFSSRRRHTRSYGDWSSDVCSSDLARLLYTVACANDGSESGVFYFDGARGARVQVNPLGMDEPGDWFDSFWSPDDKFVVVPAYGHATLVNLQTGQRSDFLSDMFSTKDGLF